MLFSYVPVFDQKWPMHMFPEITNQKISKDRNNIPSLILEASEGYRYETIFGLEHAMTQYNLSGKKFQCSTDLLSK